MGAPENQGLARPPSPVDQERADTRERPRRSTKANDQSANKENGDEDDGNENENENTEKESTGVDDLNNDDDEEVEEEEEEEDEEEEEEKKKKKKKKSYYVKKRKAVDDFIEDPSELAAQQTGGPLEPLSKKIRQPAQERAYKELSSINERIASLVQVKQMGMATAENKKQLKQLMAERKKKAYELKRLQSKQRASNKYRNKQRKIVRDQRNVFFLIRSFLFYRLII